MERYILLPPHLAAFAACAIDPMDYERWLKHSETYPGMAGVRVTVHDDRRACTVEATDGSMAALWTAPVPPLVDGSQPGSAFPDLARVTPVGTPLARVRVDVRRLALLAAAASAACGGELEGTVDVELYRHGAVPELPDAPAPLVLRGTQVQGGVFLGLLLPAKEGGQP